jgi:hypothetical protein
VAASMIQLGTEHLAGLQFAEAMVTELSHIREAKHAHRGAPRIQCSAANLDVISIR